MPPKSSYCDPFDHYGFTVLLCGLTTVVLEGCVCRHENSRFTPERARRVHSLESLDPLMPPHSTQIFHNQTSVSFPPLHLSVNPPTRLNFSPRPCSALFLITHLLHTRVRFAVASPSCTPRASSRRTTRNEKSPPPIVGLLAIGTLCFLCSAALLRSLS